MPGTRVAPPAGPSVDAGAGIHVLLYSSAGTKDADGRDQPGHDDCRSSEIDPALMLHDHRGADLHPIIEVDDILVGQAEAARRHRLSDGIRLVRAMDAVERGAEIERPRTERIVGTTGHVGGQMRLAAAH